MSMLLPIDRKSSDLPYSTLSPIVFILGEGRSSEHHRPLAQPEQVDQPLHLVVSDGLAVGHLGDLLRLRQQAALFIFLALISG